MEGMFQLKFICQKCIAPCHLSASVMEEVKEGEETEMPTTCPYTPNVRAEWVLVRS
jgi:hypothetical protein